MANQPSKSDFKLGRDSLTFLLVKYTDKPVPYKRYSLDAGQNLDPSAGIKRLEKIFLKGQVFDWANITHKESGNIIHYYNGATGTQQLTKEEYTTNRAKNNSSLKIYVIYTAQYKIRTGNPKGRSFAINDISEVKQYWNQNVMRIQVYKDEVHTHNFVNGKFTTL